MDLSFPSCIKIINNNINNNNETDTAKIFLFQKNVPSQSLPSQS